MLRRHLIICVILGMTGGPRTAYAIEGESPEAYEITIGVAAEILPSPLKEFFAEHLERLQQHATSGVRESLSGERFPGAADWHYVMLDVGGESADVTVRQFPRERSAAERHFKRHNQPSGGQLPWVIGDRHAALVEAFERRDGDAAIREAGLLLHFSTDAALPFNTTVDREGVSTGHLRWSAAKATRAARSYCTVRHRVQIALLRSLRSRLEYEARVSPDRLSPVSSPLDAAFDTLIDAHGDLGVFLAVDGQVITKLEINDASTFADNVTEYERRAGEQASSVLESRIEAGALLGANLIAGAWIEAGRPAVESLRLADRAMEQPAQTGDSTSEAFVGSRHSAVFHHTSCGHAKRIKKENLVRFGSAKEAVDAGRVPCRSCRSATP